MNSPPQFVRWNPFGELVSRVFVEGLSEVGDENLSVLLRSPDDPSGRLSLSWPQRPHAYRSVDESYRLALWQTFSPGGHAFWHSRDSLWLREFHRDSLGIYVDVDLVHFAIYTDDDCIDVISALPPEAVRLVGD
jgi:hypothetical protein